MNKKQENGVFPKHRIGQRIGSILPIASELYDAAVALSDSASYNLVLHKHLGDVFYAIATKEFFEDEHKRPIRFIIRPNHAFILDMFGITDYRVLDMDQYVLRHASVQNGLLDKEDASDLDRDNVENWLFQAIFSCIPIVGKPFVCENNIHVFFDEQLTNGLISYRLYWAYRWAGNMGVDETFKFHLPKYRPELSEAALATLQRFGDLKRIVVLAPDATTASELEPDFWDILAKIMHEQGFKVLVNSKNILIKNTVSTFDLNLSLSDVVSLCFASGYVFALRSGLCDVLASMGNRLYVFYTSMLNREMHGLNFVFEQSTAVNEIEIKNWKINPVIWQGLDLSKRLQKDIYRLKKAHRKVSIRYLFNKNNRQSLGYAKTYYERIAFGPCHLIDNNQQKHIPSVDN